MRVLLDTTVLIDIEHKERESLELMYELSKKKVDVLLSVITVSEILAGAYYTEKEENIAAAKELLAEFDFIPLEWNVADVTAEVLAYRNKIAEPIAYTDAAILATFLSGSADFLITENVKDFDFPALERKVYTAKEFLKKLKRKLV